MTEVRRYFADRVPVLWGNERITGIGTVQEVVLASDYDALRAQAVRLRAVLMRALYSLDGYTSATPLDSEDVLRDTADLVTP